MSRTLSKRESRRKKLTKAFYVEVAPMLSDDSKVKLLDWIETLK